MRKVFSINKISLVIFALIQLQLILPHQSRADSVSFNIFASDLRDATGQMMPVNGLVILVASTNDAAFGAPTSTAFTTGDDIVLAKWDLNGFGEPGLLLDAANGLQLTGGWNAGDPPSPYFS